MYRLLDYNQTQRYVKIENMFSTKKYPIYFSYDPQTCETYITKVIRSKDIRVINYFKHHINENILPYLRMKREFKCASILSIPVEDAEVFIKINQDQKNKKQKQIKEKIAQVTKLLRCYTQYHKNDHFQNQIKQINEFLNSLSIKETSLFKKIQQVKDSICQIGPLITFVSSINIRENYIVDVLSELKQTAQHSEDQLIDNFFRLIQQLKKKQTQLNEQSLKSNEIFQLSNELQSLQAFFSNTILNLKSIKQYQNNAFENEIEFIYNNLTKHEKQLQEEVKRIYESNTLFITKKYIKGMTLRQMIINKDERLTPQFSFNLLKAIIDFIFLNGGIKDLFITTENIIVEDCGTFHLNYFSFVGLEFIKLNKFVPRSDFQQILPYINHDYLYHPKQGKIEIQIYLRFIIVNFVSALFVKDIIFDPKSIDFQIEVRTDYVDEQILRIQNRLFGKILTNEEKVKIKQFDNSRKVRYSQLVQTIFNRNEKSSKFDLSWEDIFSKLSRDPMESFSKIYGNGSSKNIMTGFNILNINSNFQSSSKVDPSAFYVINISFMEIIDHYTNILNQLVKYNESNNLLHDLGNKNQEKIKKIAQRQLQERNYFEKKGWYCSQLFIPIKTQMTFTQILDHSNWVHMLFAQTQPNIKTVKGVQNLLCYLLEVEEIMKLIEPLLTETVLLQSLKNQKCLYYTKLSEKGEVLTYYSNLHSYKSNKKNLKRTEDTDINLRQEKQSGSDSEQRERNYNFELKSEQSEDDDKEQYNFKKMFWKCFFSTLKIIYLLVKKYYIRINAININEEILINGDKYIKLLEEFKPQIPPLTVQS